LVLVGRQDETNVSSGRNLEKKMASDKRNRPDPVIPDQGGRLTPSDPAESGQEKVRRRAYELYEERRKQEGNAEADWLEAEAQTLRNPRNR
jgi:hypothetical protein